MAALSVVAWIWQPRIEAGDRTELVWVSDDNPVRREQIELFNKLNPDYHLRLDPQNTGMEKVIVQSLAGVGPDVFDCYTGFQLMAFVRSGIALDVTDELAARGADPDAVWPCLKPLFMLNGRVYGHPDNTHAPAIWYNKKMFDEAGVPYPTSDWTWAEFIDIAERLTVRDARGRPRQFGLMMGRWDWQSIFLPKWGARFYTPEGTRCILDSPEAAAGAQFVRDLMFEYEVMPTATEEMAMATAGGWGSGPISMFGGGRAAMAIGGRWWLCILRQKDYAHLDLGAVAIPAGPVTDELWGGGRSTLVNANSENIDGALAFLEYMHGPHWNRLVNRQADALGPVRKYHYGEYEAEFLRNPEHPDEDYNDVWRTALENAVPTEVSPYVNGQRVERIMTKQTDLIWAGLKTGEEAMTDAAREINEAIVEQLEIDPVLREQYYAALEAGAQPAWDNKEDTPQP